MIGLACILIAVSATPADPTPAQLRATITHWRMNEQASDPDMYADYQRLAVKFLKSRDKETRLAGAWALVRIGNSEHVRPLCSALKDKEADVQREAARALGAIADDKSVPALEKHIAADGGATMEAIRALEDMGTGPAFEALKRLSRRINGGSQGIAIASAINRLEGNP